MKINYRSHLVKYRHYAGTLLLTVFVCTAIARNTLNINQNWKFTYNDVNGAEAVSFNDDSWQTVHLPHTFKCIGYHDNLTRGIGWYRYTFTLDAADEGKKVFVEFGAAMTVAQVYVNGEHFDDHLGGFTPFIYDITDEVIFGGENLIALRIDNTDQSQNDIPPEKSEDPNFDYYLFGGLYRSVNLIITEKMYVPDPINEETTPGGGTFITTPTVSTSSATVRVKTVVTNENDSQKSCMLRTTLTNQSGTVVGTEETTQNIASNGTYVFTQDITVSNPSLWSPTNPALYTAHTEVYDNTILVDTYTTRFGIRSIEFRDGNGFYLNGTRVKLLGVNRHQMLVYIGSAMGPYAQQREARLLKDMGCNYVRLSHYPQDPAFMDALDEFGIMCWVELPGWGGGQKNATFQARSVRNVRDMIRRDRNHPCVIIWGCGINEMSRQESFEIDLNNMGHAEDNTRLTTMARQYGVSSGQNIFDVYGRNAFTPNDFPTAIEDNQCIGFLHAEHTGHTYPKARWDPASDLIEQAHRHEQMTEKERTYTWCAGGTGWGGFDYNTSFNSYQNVAYHGVSDIFRIPKFAYYFYQSQCAADDYDGSKNPMVHILSFADYSMPSTQTIKLYSNCDEVELFVNGTSVGTQSPDNGRTLAHPPFTFSNVNFSSPGTLRADGKINGTVVATHTVQRAGSASTIVLEPDTDTLVSDGSDFARVVVSVVDNNGTVVRSASNTINVSVSGPARVICGANGPQTSGSVRVEAGQLAFLVQAGIEEGEVTVTATASGLTQDQITLVIGTPTAAAPWSGSPVHGPGIQQPVITVRQGTLQCGNLVQETNARIMVVAMNGRIIKQLTSTGARCVAIPISDCPTGIYTVVVRYPTHRFAVKALVCKSEYTIR